MTIPFTLRWATNAEHRRAAARFLAQAVKTQPSYISHGEMHEALSPDGKVWAPDLEARLLREFEPDRAEHSVALAERAGALVGLASVWWEKDAPAPHAVLADVAVDSTLRDEGIGAALVDFAEAEARRRGFAWMFLESGVHNDRAHAFFERAGFVVVSKVFAKKL